MKNLNEKRFFASLRMTKITENCILRSETPKTWNPKPTVPPPFGLENQKPETFPHQPKHPIRQPKRGIRQIVPKTFPRSPHLAVIFSP
ncbi:hypothetical protein [Flagellimonas baculiformis]|uniref:hypothetical protein n=1 Tax=Flagellimonas baculiformis TaxID=3067310 RepID=UPI00296E9778|nr:hypothetical protein [Muricauda sp. D6]